MAGRDKVGCSPAALPLDRVLAPLAANAEQLARRWEAALRGRCVNAEAAEGGRRHAVEMHTPLFYVTCALSGVLSTGLTHLAVTPLDMVKCNMQVDPSKYRDISTSFRVMLREQGLGGFFKGWMATLVGYSGQGACKFGFYEFFKKCYSDIAGPENAEKLSQAEQSLLNTSRTERSTLPSKPLAFFEPSRKRPTDRRGAMAPNLSKARADLAVEGFKPSRFTLKGKDLAVDGLPFLLDVPANIRLTPASTLVGGDAGGGSFLGFDAPAAKSRHVVPVGKLRDTRFMSIFRFKVWWTTHWVGDRGGDVENETQMMVLDRSAERPYVLLLPIVEGAFRACLEAGKVDDYVDLCVESGSSAVTGAVFRSALYLHAGDNPFELVKQAAKVVRAHLGTFRLMEEKTPPPIVDKFGWCTWDAFYLNVHPEGVWEGVRRLAEGGCPPGLVLIDDGWQSICHDEDDPNSGEEGMNRTSAGEQMPCRLIKFQENHKFREYKKGGMGQFVREMKAAFPTVEQVYVWHALCGYWGGLRPGTPGLPPAKVVEPKLSPGLQRTMEDLAVDKIVNNGVGLVDPKRAHELFEGLHSHLKASGIDGVKVDVIHLLEMLCEEYGGRVELAKAYFSGLTASVRRHFGGNGVIASMEHCNDFMLLGTEAVALGRVGDDFWCTDPSGDPNGTFWLQGCHMVHCAYNSLWMGNFIHPDWDMFQSTHPCAAFHAASRAVSGGPIYVSDSVGQHDFALLRRLALPDGTILRCEGYALPTRDCLFQDPLHDGRTMLKIWNVNRFAGVVGAFNCQGGGWSPEARRNKCFSQFSVPVTARASPADVEWKSAGVVNVKGVSQFAVYMVEARTLRLLRPDDGVELTLEPFTYELLVVAPVRVVSPERAVKFAPIGLANMLNTAGAVQSFETKTDAAGAVTVEVGVKGAGEMVAYSSVRPRLCKVNGEEVEFAYKDGMVTVDVPWSGSSSKLCRVEYVY